MNDLKPTLWKTCRILANENRLACLREVIAQPGLDVGTLAHRLMVSEHHASMMLRALQSRGLIRPVRQSRWVYYYPLPDPLVKSAAPVLSAIRKKLLNPRAKLSSIIRILTAFTHPRRLAILGRLQECGAQTEAEMSARLGISRQAMTRHLRKLTRRGLILQEDFSCRLLPARDVLARALLREIARS